MSSIQFPQFKNLPLELRNHVWNKALPEGIPPAAFLYKPGCWTSKIWPSSEPGSDPREGKPTLEFRHELLAEIPFPLPMSWVCHESRALAIRWIERQRSLRIETTSKGTTLISHGLDPARDAMYIPPSSFDAFCQDAYDTWEKELLGEQIQTHGGTLETLAISSSTMSSENVHELALMLEQWLGAVKLVLMVFNSDEMESYLSDGHRVLRGRWEFEEIGEGHEDERRAHLKAAEVEASLSSKLSLPENTPFRVRPRYIRRAST